MSFVVWTAAAMVATSMPVAWWAFSGERPSKQRASQNLAGVSPTMRQAVLRRSPLERVVLPLTRHIGSRLVHLTPIGWVGGRNQALARAGLTGRVTAEQILGAKLVIPAATAVLAAVSTLGEARWRSVLALLAVAGAGFFIPDLLVRAKGDRRAGAITSALPDLLDQVTISVEAGLAFESALGRSSGRRNHPLAEEVDRMLQDVCLGSTRSEALAALAERSQVDDLRSVVLALRQADSLGAPLAEALRVSANDIRERRRYRAEEQAQRLPTLMIFPLGLCVLPALFIVILGPAMVSGSGLR
jgi:tight adherence protein C